MKILHIGQLPMEVGGNYSTGMGKVVYELSKCSYSSDELYIYGINTNDKKIKNLAPSQSKYLGYHKNIIEILFNLLTNPIDIIKIALKASRTLPYSLFRGLFYSSDFQRIIRKVQPDIIHIHSIDYAIPLSLAKKKFNIPVLLTCHGIFNIKKKHRYKLYQESLKCVDYVSVLTADIRNIITAVGFPIEKTTIIPNGVDASTFYYSSQDRQQIREKFGLGDGTTLFLTVGSIQERKGQYTFLKDLMRSGMDFAYWMIGDGPDKEKISVLIADQNLQDRVKILGYIDAKYLYKYYSAADIYAHVSEQEGQALSEIEAYTTGLKVIVNKSVETTIVNPQKDTNLYFIDSVGNINWDKCCKWLAIPQHRTTRPNFDWQIIANRYDETYHKIIETCHI